MPTDAHFLAAIAAAPLDALPKLVYADWLDEHDDPRGQLIRLDAELLATPPADDRYWHLHARRDDLLTGVDADWLAAVRVGNDCAPMLTHGWPADVKGRWRTVRAAAERLLNRPIGDVGGYEDRIARSEAELGEDLPESLREWVAFVGEAFVRDDEFLNDFADTLTHSDDQELIFLRVDDEYQMAVRSDDIGLPDPPVTPYWQDWDDADAVWQVDGDEPDFPAVSDFALFHLLNECHGTAGRVEVSVGRKPGPGDGGSRRRVPAADPPRRPRGVRAAGHRGRGLHPGGRPRAGDGVGATRGTEE